MRTRSPLRRTLALALTSALALALVPIDITPAEAGRIKVRTYSTTRSTYVNRADDETRGQRRSPFSIRFRDNSGSSEDERSSARAKPQGAAAAAAARARAALEAESATRASAATVHKPVPIGETKSYSNGVMCVAGC